METMTFCVPCLFGLEGLVGDELRRLELSNVRVEDRRVFFEGDFAAMAKANLCCRMGERVMILLSEFDAHSFEDLFQGVKATPLERFIPKDGAFPVKGYSLNSQLHSVPDCQAIVKKAAVTRLGEKYGLGWMPETGETYQLRFSIMKDHVELFLDTSGVSLHKRGYRREANLAPLHETMAAAMVNLARYRGRDFFWDPFCGSGTICIEAAMIALNRAPGLNRSFMACPRTRAFSSATHPMASGCSSSAARSGCTARSAGISNMPTAGKNTSSPPNRSSSITSASRPSRNASSTTAVCSATCTCTTDRPDTDKTKEKGECSAL